MAFGRVLITGGAGFVGSQLLKRIEPLADHVYVIDDLSSGSRDAVISSDKVTFIQGSYYQEDLLEEVLPRVEWIFHLACSSLSSSVIDIKKDYSTNLYGAFVLLEKVRALCPTLHRIVYTSTASVYGNAPVRPTPETYYQITTAYAASKFAAEHYFEMYFRNFRLPVTTVRLSNVFGPGQVSSNPYCGVVAKFFECLQNGEPFRIFGDGLQTRDFTYVEDAIDAILLAAVSANSIGKLYNIGTGIETNIRQLAETIASIGGYRDYPFSYLPKRPIDHIAYRSVDCRLIREDLHWMPKYTLEQGLRKTDAWLKQQQSE
ncbi:NAD-dependent epimerase/dehydratase family protein [Paenibacillus macerans]|uniref:NAD-dependent epimerase/dehydratase family protein n=1 Tax=Paenibacillus macerans TaxID=44252 RepID=UPI001F0D8E44|nr:NAD-dependent epimerase/dehydratase family protein [Paenibacillus macerans]MBS5914936.1 NAD-dependent epimerase/dehydratase family protein [Paenibacillus macerans]MDU5945960.1 NAD-dependent epimerase/dehydratase family protein [Paenibacillus macerans]MEC0141352.1 NAD-dependent epimerase/dehydratase family protein [Paenibacillus macerans]UMV45308.1 NAD-dependent epimerase/dehydratase family protein [Paenibacillus macerans]